MYWPVNFKGPGYFSQPLTSASSDSGTRGASAFASFVPFVASFVAALEGVVEVLAAGEAEALAEGEVAGSFRLASSLSGWTLAAHPAVRTARPPSRRVRRARGAEGLTVLERALKRVRTSVNSLNLARDGSGHPGRVHGRIRDSRGSRGTNPAA